MMKTKAVRVHGAGGPEILEFETVDIAEPGDSEVLLRHTAIGVNLIDTYHRSSADGQYALPRPTVLGVEAVGVIEKVGKGVDYLKAGDRVGYWNPPGAYAQRRGAPAWRMIKIPDGVANETAAALMLKGATAFYLLHKVWNTKAGDVILVHAAAGGVGRLLCQWASNLGAKVIGAVGSDGKIEAAKAAGCVAVLNNRAVNFVDRVRQLAPGGLDVVFDSIGMTTFDASIDVLRPLGLMVSYGQASGPIPPFDISVLAKKGSIFLAKPTLATFTQNREGLSELANGVFSALENGTISVEIGLTAPLSDVANVHRALESSATTGSVILSVD